MIIPSRTRGGLGQEVPVFVLVFESDIRESVVRRGGESVRA